MLEEWPKMKLTHPSPSSLPLLNLSHPRVHVLTGVVLWIEVRAPSIPGKCSITEPHPWPTLLFLCLYFFSYSKRGEQLNLIGDSIKETCNPVYQYELLPPVSMVTSDLQSSHTFRRLVFSLHPKTLARSTKGVEQ